MAWLTRWWGALLRDLVFTGSGLAVIATQVALTYLPGGQPNPYLIGAGLSLTFPTTYVRFREHMDIAGSAGLSGPPSLPPGAEPSPPLSPVSTGD